MVSQHDTTESLRCREPAVGSLPTRISEGDDRLEVVDRLRCRLRIRLRRQARPASHGATGPLFANRASGGGAPTRSSPPRLLLPLRRAGTISWRLRFRHRQHARAHGASAARPAHAAPAARPARLAQLSAEPAGIFLPRTRQSTSPSGLSARSAIRPRRGVKRGISSFWLPNCGGPYVLRPGE